MKPFTRYASTAFLSAALLAPISSVFLSTTPLARAADTASLDQKASQSIDKAVNYLKSVQQPDGSWQKERQPIGITAIVLSAIVEDGKHKASDDWVKKGYDKLLSYQLEDGGIYKDVLANYNTAISISALAAADEPQFKPHIDKAVNYLKSLQWTDQIKGGPHGEKNIDVSNPWYGGAGYGGSSKPDGSNTQMMLEALHDAGLKSDDPAFKAALKFVSRMQNNSETNDQKWAGNDGGAVYTPANNGESKAGEYTGPDGRRMVRSYGSMTYAMLKSYIYAGLTHDDPRVKAAWDWISKNFTVDENPGMRAGNPSYAQYGLYYYYLTMARALHAYGQPIITDPQGNEHDWRVELINKLTSLQHPDGSFVGEKRFMEDDPTLVTSYAALALEETRADLKDHPVRK